jgi:hypothetical protein
MTDSNLVFQVFGRQEFLQQSTGATKRFRHFTSAVLTVNSSPYTRNVTLYATVVAGAFCASATSSVQSGT